MLFNIHLLYHLVQSVYNWGPLWVNSALPFESFNKKILQFVTSPHARAEQIVTRFFLKKFIVVAAAQIQLAVEARREVYRLLKINNEHIAEVSMSEGHYFQGLEKEEARYPHPEEVNMIRAAGNLLDPERHIRLYRRAIINGTEYRVQDDIRRKFCNYIAFCEPLQFFLIEKFLTYRSRGRLVAGFIGKHLHMTENVYRTTYMQRVGNLESRYFVSYNSVISPGFKIPSTQEHAVVSLCNVWETD